MSIEEFELLPMRPGWKHEYWHGRAHITPRHNAVIVSTPVTRGEVGTNLFIRRVSNDDALELTAAFLDAFADSVEYCDWEPHKIVEAAHKAILSHFAGERGKPHSASRVALAFDPERGRDSILAAALLTQALRYPILDLLFVRPSCQRQGIATTLLSAAMNELHDNGETLLKSAYYLANEASMKWHQRSGFVEEPDLLRARLYSSSARHELWRREKIGDLTNDEKSELQTYANTWEAEVERLEEIADREGYEAVAPIMTWLE